VNVCAGFKKAAGLTQMQSFIAEKIEREAGNVDEKAASSRSEREQKQEQRESPSESYWRC
jgi:hypothetical protein